MTRGGDMTWRQGRSALLVVVLAGTLELGLASTI